MFYAIASWCLSLYNRLINIKTPKTVDRKLNFVLETDYRDSSPSYDYNRYF